MNSHHKEDQMNQLIGQMQDNCQLIGSTTTTTTKMQQQKRGQEANQADNNNDDHYANKYPTLETLGHEHRPAGQLKSSRSIGGESASSASSSSAFSASSSSSSNSGDDDDDDDYQESATGDGHLLLADVSSSTSGRSSANDSASDLAEAQSSSSSPDCCTAGELKQLNTICNLAPESRQALELVGQVRARFLAQLGGLREATEFEELDLAELRRPLPSEPSGQEQSLAFRWISRFLNFNDLLKLSSADITNEAMSSNDQQQQQSRLDQELDEACEKLREFLQFRRHYRVPLARADQFCREIFQLNGIFPFGCDKNNLPILYLRARVHRRWSHKLDEQFRRYVAWQVDLITKSHQGADRQAPVAKRIGRNQIEKDGSFGICFDCLNVSYSCVDMDFLKFLVKILVNYYPTYCRYALCVDLPWLFRSVWKLVRSWLPEEAQNTVQLITSKQLTDFIDKSQIPNSMRTVDGRKPPPPEGKHRLPDDWARIRDLDGLAEELKLSSSEVKQFRQHLAKVLKEYEQLGAI